MKLRCLWPVAHPRLVRLSSLIPRGCISSPVGEASSGLGTPGRPPENPQKSNPEGSLGTCPPARRILRQDPLALMKTSHVELLCRYMIGDDLPEKESSHAQTLHELCREAYYPESAKHSETAPPGRDGAPRKSAIRKLGYLRLASPSPQHSGGNRGSSRRLLDALARIAAWCRDKAGRRKPQSVDRSFQEDVASQRSFFSPYVKVSRRDPGGALRRNVNNLAATTAQTLNGGDVGSVGLFDAYSVAPPVWGVLTLVPEILSARVRPQREFRLPRMAHG